MAGVATPAKEAGLPRWQASVRFPAEPYTTRMPTKTTTIDTFNFGRSIICALVAVSSIWLTGCGSSRRVFVTVNSMASPEHSAYSTYSLGLLRNGDRIEDPTDLESREYFAMIEAALNRRGLVRVRNAQKPDLRVTAGYSGGAVDASRVISVNGSTSVLQQSAWVNVLSIHAFGSKPDSPDRVELWRVNGALSSSRIDLREAFPYLVLATTQNIGLPSSLKGTTVQFEYESPDVVELRAEAVARKW